MHEHVVDDGYLVSHSVSHEQTTDSVLLDEIAVDLFLVCLFF